MQPLIPNQCKVIASSLNQLVRIGRAGHDARLVVAQPGFAVTAGDCLRGVAVARGASRAQRDCCRRTLEERSRPRLRANWR